MRTVDYAKRRMPFVIGMGEVKQIMRIKRRITEASLVACVQKAIEVCEKQLSDMHSQTTSLLSMHSLDDWMTLVRNANPGQLSSLEENAWKARFGYFSQADPTRLSWSRGEADFLIRLMEWYQTRAQRLLYIKTYGQVYHSENANTARVSESMTIPNSGLISTIKGSKLPLILPFHTVSLSFTQRKLLYESPAVYPSADGSNYSTNCA